LNSVCEAVTCGINPAEVEVLRSWGISTGTYALFEFIREPLMVLVFVSISLLIFWRRSNERIALLFSIELFVLGLASGYYKKIVSSFATGPVKLLYNMDQWNAVLLIILFLIFPTGRFVPGWTRWAAVGAVAVTMANLFPASSPINPANWSQLLQNTTGLSLFIICIFAQIYRYFRISSPVQQQQTKWVVCGFIAVVVVVIYSIIATVLSVNYFSHPDGPPVSRLYYNIIGVPVAQLIYIFFPLSIAIAIMRYRLWDIDILINRSLVFVSLSALLIAIYIVVVSQLDNLFRASGSLPISLIGTGVVAVLFSPLRERLQRGVNRLMYGERDDPYTVISRLGQRLEATLDYAAVLPTIVETVGQGLKLPYAALALKRPEGYAIQATYPATPPENTGKPDEVLPLAFQGEELGHLLLAWRAPGEPFTPADRRLLEDITHQAGVALHALQLTIDLQHSRERLVTTREEERRRLRRDLHDGLGPSLASIMMKLDATRNVMARDPRQAEAWLVESREQVRTAIADIRRLVYELRPPALDDLGLAGAIREYTRNLNANKGVQVQVEMPEHLPPLSAAVEVAIYRIVLEALTNVVRHAQARSCQVILTADGRLDLVIQDDGLGLPDKVTPGVGLTSIRERTAELGGNCVFETFPAGGTRVHIQLPLVIV
ncbi:MAG: GAF domain-containing sensor histidine kinase, partial [Chloroflexi bacterium]|nr:GAF domain-containing sensor histidine kinase [Chloroflexota bacterium]